MSRNKSTSQVLGLFNKQRIKNMRILRLNLILCGIASLLVSACSFNSHYVPSFVKPYRFDIQQGNFVTQEDTDRLQNGMSRDQVRFIMGTPLLNDAFHTDRWDYVYRLLRANRSVIESRYTVIFKDDKLVKHFGENLPEDQQHILNPAPKPNEAKRPDPAVQTDITKPAIPADKGGITGTERAPIMK
jgi:outer membrane protein assembly factor BamE